jgi:hypothetical protein
VTWGRVASVLSRAVSALASRGRAWTGASKAASGPATPTATTSSANGKQHFDLTARALRLNNRCPTLTARYLAKIEALRAGPGN